MSNTRAAPSPALAPPPGHPRFPLMDGLRGMALIGIITLHAGGPTVAYKYPHWGPYIAHLNVSLVLFFSLSGFLMYRPFVAARRLGSPAIRVGDYTRRRLLRIVPAYWVALTLLTIYPGLWAVTDNPLFFYAFLQGLAPLMADFECVPECGIPASWSLGIEMTFYLTLPLFAWLVARSTRGASRRRWLYTELGVIGGLGVVSLLLPVLSPEQAWYGRGTLLGAFTWFTAGLALAVLSVALHGREDSSRAVRLVTAYSWVPWAAAAGLYALLCTGLGSTPDGDFVGDTKLQTAGYQILAIASIFLLLLPAVFGDGAGGLVRRFLANRVLVWIGVVSYGAYLFHLTVIGELDFHGVGTVFGSREFVTLTTASVIVSCAFGAASYYLVERPFLRLKNRRFSDSAPIRRLRVRLAGARGRRVSASTPGSPPS